MNDTVCIACSGTGKNSRGGLCVCRSRIPQHQSSSTEHFTPSYIVEAARELMCGIDLDPASCELAQEIVKAQQWFGKEQNGLSQSWYGNVFLNPPGGLTPEYYKGLGARSFATLWWAKLAAEFAAGNIKQGFFVGFTLEIFRTAQNIDTMCPTEFSFCIPRQRIRFDREENGKRIKSNSPTHANVLIWLADHNRQNKQRFIDIFSKIGAVRV